MAPSDVWRSHQGKGRALSLGEIAGRARHPSAWAGGGGTGRPRPLNQPVRVQHVETNPEGEPVVVVLRGQRRAVAEVIERWKLDEGWWQPDPVSRRYFRLVLDDGRIMTVFRSVEGNEGRSWWMQRP